ncbi:uncharacterized protein LOC106639077 isoform X2 [Copidosoma floridanum]|uniref:uncharacterized protein LOC106639077 isoform X2 n=1 Tax=Copidosoma floridanum TaxID=29053 RepID=UPI0006C98FBB|nr:uncharacterized protein LOC106639077 isoform X2 [Copidosoma floridanum]
MSKLRERQYQQQAQRRHEDNLRHDYYQRTARYFERETEAARQFASWTTRGPEAYKRHVERKRKEEQLQERRDKLRKLLQEEEEGYRRELEELEKARKQRRTRQSGELPAPVIDKLLDQQSLTNGCRRRFIRTPSESPLGFAPESTLRPDSGDSQKQTRLSTSSSPYNTLVNNSKIMSAQNQQSLSPKSSGSSLNGNQSSNLRYAARQSTYAPSLSNTNMRDNKVEDQSDASSQASEICDVLSVQQQENESRMERMESRLNQMELKSKNDESNQHTEVDCVSEKHTTGLETEFCRIPTPSQKSVSDQDQAPSSRPGSEHLQCAPFDFETIGHRVSTMDNRIPEHNQVSLDNPVGDPNLYFSSKGLLKDDKSTMRCYRYLKNNDLKTKILDLCKREQFAVAKQSWDEALRIREMRNELILLKNKNLYDNKDLDIDDEVRKSALKLIEMREDTRKKREKMCNYSMYSEEAKDMWKQWVQEDEKFSKMETDGSADEFLQKIEEDWKQLEMRDKQRMFELYNYLINHSESQDEQHLAAAFRNANGRQRRYSDLFES